MRSIISLSAIALLGLAFGSSAALAQSAGPDEAIKPNGSVGQTLGLTPVQKKAIYNAVFQQRSKPAPTLLSTAVGAPVPPSIELIDLPEEAAAGNPGVLKYATVDNDVVIVDSVGMSVVDVIYNAARR